MLGKGGGVEGIREISRTVAEALPEVAEARRGPRLVEMCVPSELARGIKLATNLDT